MYRDLKVGRMIRSKIDSNDWNWVCREVGRGTGVGGVRNSNELGVSGSDGEESSRTGEERGASFGDNGGKGGRYAAGVEEECDANISDEFD